MNILKLTKLYESDVSDIACDYQIIKDHGSGHIRIILIELHVKVNEFLQLDNPPLLHVAVTIEQNVPHYVRMKYLLLLQIRSHTECSTNH